MSANPDARISALEQRMIDYAADLAYDELDANVVHHAKRRILDTIGGALAAYDAEPARIARVMAQPVTAGPAARIFGSLEVTSPEMAAFANGAMLRYLDINDTHRTIDGSHPSDNLGGVLAVAEANGCSGRDLIVALTISYELQCRFVDSVPFNDNGWDQPVPGVMACALATGRLMGLNRDALRDALALAVVPNLCTHQTRAGELSMWKGCAAANGARQGVFAAYLAREGLSGPYDAFDGIFGLWNQTLGKPYDVSAFARDGDTFAICQTNIKKYPVRDSCQLAVDTALELRDKIAAEDTTTLKISTYESAHKGAVADPELWAPKTRETADHSMLVAISTALIDGEVTPQTFTSERFLDADILTLIGRTEVEISEEFSKQTPAIRSCLIEATDANGIIHSALGRLTAEDIGRGPTDAQLESKFHNLNADVLPQSKRDELLHALWNIDDIDDVGRLVDKLAL